MGPPCRRPGIYPGQVSSETPRDGDLLVRIGAIVFLVGAVATLATVAPLFLGADPLPTAAYFVSMLMGVGFLIAAAGVLRAVAAQRRQARAALSPALAPESASSR
ncbi:hypothetical protein CTZ27_24680 [Streptomyces griseocarneus]|nr:hypothetical protein CTZ27_24680 [Streptomyces griseocarneus]